MPTNYFVSRHPGARAWASQQGLKIDRFAEHLDPAIVQPGDTVYGSLPVNLAASVCERGARYFHLCLDLPAEQRGMELDLQDMTRFHAHLEQFRIERAEP